MPHAMPHAMPHSGRWNHAVRRARLATLCAVRLAAYAVLLAACAALLAACGSDDDPAPVAAQGPLEIIGTYTDDFGGPHVITQSAWDQTTPGFALLFHILEYSNAEDTLLARNDAFNAFNPDLYSRFTWSTYLTGLYFCQNPFDATTLEAARAAPKPDATDPTAGGCGGFAWSKLNR